MTPLQTLDLALECLRKEMHRVAVDANLHDRYHADYPAAVKASAYRLKLRLAEHILLELKHTLQPERNPHHG